MALRCSCSYTSRVHVCIFSADSAGTDERMRVRPRGREETEKASSSLKQEYPRARRRATFLLFRPSIVLNRRPSIYPPPPASRFTLDLAGKTSPRASIVATSEGFQIRRLFFSSPRGSLGSHSDKTREREREREREGGGTRDFAGMFSHGCQRLRATIRCFYGSLWIRDRKTCFQKTTEIALSQSRTSIVVLDIRII